MLYDASFLTPEAADQGEILIPINPYKEKEEWNSKYQVSYSDKTTILEKVPRLHKEVERILEYGGKLVDLQKEVDAHGTPFDLVAKVTSL